VRRIRTPKESGMRKMNVMSRVCGAGSSIAAAYARTPNASRHLLLSNLAPAFGVRAYSAALLTGRSLADSNLAVRKSESPHVVSYDLRYLDFAAWFEKTQYPYG
jgi:hypothetical protein